MRTTTKHLLMIIALSIVLLPAWAGDVDDHVDPVAEIEAAWAEVDHTEGCSDDAQAGIRIQAHDLLWQLFAATASDVEAECPYSGVGTHDPYGCQDEQCVCDSCHPCQSCSCSSCHNTSAC